MLLNKRVTWIGKGGGHTHSTFIPEQDTVRKHHFQGCQGGFKES